ncbi:unnamed protein product, partial [Heterotrigona itama]
MNKAFIAYQTYCDFLKKSLCSWLGSRFKMINELIETLLLEKNQINNEESDEVVIFKPSNNLGNRLRIDNSLSDSIDAPNSDQGSSTDEKLRSLQQIRFLHLQVCNVSKMVNNIFNNQILIYTLTMLIYVSIMIYSIYIDFRRSHDFVKVINPMYLYLLDSIISILKIPVMSYDCEYTMRQCFYFVITYLVIMIQLSQNLMNDSLSDATGNETSTFQTILQENTTALRNFIDPRKNLFKFVCSWIWNISVVVMILLIQLSTTASYIKTVKFYVQRIIYSVQDVCHVYGYIVIIIIGLCQSKNALTLVKQIDQVDKDLKQLGIEIDYRNLFRHVKIMGSFWLLSVVVPCGIFIRWIIETQSFSYMMLCTFSYVFVTNAHWLGSRFKMINELLETLNDERTNGEESDEEITFTASNSFRSRLRTKVTKVSPVGKTSNFKRRWSIDEKVRLLQKIRFLHLRVCNVSKMVNHIFNVQILIYSFTKFLYISITGYFIYINIRKKTDFTNWLNLTLIFMFDGIVGTLKIPLITYDCEYTIRQINITMNNYGATTRIITILNHIAALRNFIDPRKNPFKFVCSWTWNIFLILMIVVVQFHADLNFLQRNYAFNIERITYIFQYVTHAFGYTSTVIIGLCQSKNALRLMEQIDRVDENLKNLGIEIDHRCLFRHVKIVGSFWLLNAIIILGIFITWIVRTIPLLYFPTLTYIYITNAQSVVLYDYNTAIFWLGSRFKMINQLMKTLLPLEDDERNAKESNEEIVFKPSSNFRNRLEIDNCSSSHSAEVSQIPFINDTSKFEKESPTVEKLRLLQQIRSLHLQLCSVSKLVNHMFNVQILIYTFTTLIYLSASTYWIYMEIQRKADVVEKLDHILIFMLDGVAGTLKIAVMSYDCEYAMRQ